MNLDNSSVKLRAATFVLTYLEYSQSIEICDTFLTFPSKYILSHAYFTDIWKKVREKLCMVNTTEEIGNIMKAILPVLNKPVELKLMPGNYDITQQNPVWLFRNFSNIFFHDLHMNVTFMTADTWMVPDPIQYELLSLS